LKFLGGFSPILLDGEGGIFFKFDCVHDCPS
jgi:hypothetical protein